MCPPSSATPQDDLPYIVEIWDESGAQSVERVLARATSAKLARAILKSAEQEYPGRRITLRLGDRLVEDINPANEQQQSQAQADPAH